MNQTNKSPTKRQGSKNKTTSFMNVTTVTNIGFIGAAFAGVQADETPWVAGFPGENARWFGGPAIPLPGFIHPSNNNYISNSTYRPKAGSIIYRQAEYWSGLWLVLLDDIGTKVEKAKALRLPPTCLVETSPGNFQGWLFLSAPERNADKADALLHGIRAMGLGDPGACKRGQYGRLPVGTNGKAKHRDASGNEWVQRVHEWHPERRYSVEQIADAYGIDLTPKPKRPCKTPRTAPTHDADGYIELLDWAGLYQEEIRGKAGTHRITCPWHEQHTGGDKTGTAYFEPDEANDMRGGFKCQHGHCQHLNINDLDRYIGRLAELRDQKARAAA